MFRDLILGRVSCCCGLAAVVSVEDWGSQR